MGERALLVLVQTQRDCFLTSAFVTPADHNGTAATRHCCPNHHGLGHGAGWQSCSYIGNICHLPALPQQLSPAVSIVDIAVAAATTEVRVDGFLNAVNQDIDSFKYNT